MHFEATFHAVLRRMPFKCYIFRSNDFGKILTCPPHFPRRVIPPIVGEGKGGGQEDQGKEGGVGQHSGIIIIEAEL